MYVKISKTLLGVLSTLTAWCAIVTFIIGLLLRDSSLLFWTFNIMWISNILYCIDKYSGRFIFLVLNLTYFLFYMGRITLTYIFKGDFALDFDNSIIVETFTIIGVGLIALRLFAYLFDNSEKTLRPSESKIEIHRINEIAKWVFWITYPFAVIVILERVFFVRATDYANYYVNYVTVLPGIVSKLDAINEIMFFLFLGTYPSQKKVKWPIIAFLFLGVLSLGYGQRNPLAMKFVLVFLIYIPLRNVFREENETVWVTRKYKFFCIVSIAALVLLMSFWKFYRLGETSLGSLGDLILDFFDTEGNSAYLIAETSKNIDRFPADKIYTLEPVYGFLTNNFIYKLLFGTKAVAYGFTPEYAMTSWNFGMTLSYVVNPRAYALGVGMGTCYLSEVFVDFGYFGIFAISALYMKIIAYVQKNYGKNWLMSTIGLLSVYEIIYAPRDLALSFVGEFFSFTFIVVVFIIWLLYRRKNIWKSE